LFLKKEKLPKKEFLVSIADDNDPRLDVFLSIHLNESNRSQIKHLIDLEKVQVNGICRKASFRVKTGDEINVEFASRLEQPLLPENIPLDIIYRDDFLVVINKAAGMVVHPGAGNPNGTLVNAILHHFPEIAAVGPAERPGIVHRLDKDTSGVMVAALTQSTFISMQQQFQDRKVKKQYMGLVWGRLTIPEGKIDKPIGRHVKRGDRISVKTNRPREAVTHYSVKKVYPGFSLLDIQPLTGRMHQIRVHMAASGFPIVGDTLYGRKKNKIKCPRLFLHAAGLTFLHPSTKNEITFKAPLPNDLKYFLDKFIPEKS